MLIHYYEFVDSSDYLSKYLNLLKEILTNSEISKINSLFDALNNRFENKERVFFAGNGGSAAIASHAATDLGNLLINEKQLNAISLTSNIPLITASANDKGYENLFINIIENFNPTKKDLVIPISSSGNSKNIINLIDYCNQTNIPTFALLGFDGGKAKSIADEALVLNTPNNYYGPVEDLHMMIFHIYSHITKNDIKQLN
jgi:D-sedoheptulose 7-phosphate isomerase